MFKDLFLFLIVGWLSLLGLVVFIPMLIVIAYTVFVILQVVFDSVWWVILIPFRLFKQLWWEEPWHH